MDVGLLIVRLVVGGLLAAHGLQHLTTRLGGHGIAGNAEFLRSLGYRGARAMAWLHGIGEIAGGVMLALGLFTPLASAAIIAVMVNAAVAVHAPNGLWVQQNGYEYPLVLSTVAAGMALTGPGALAIDAWVGLDLADWGAAGIILGVVLGVAALAMRHRVHTQGPDAREHRDLRTAA